MNKETRLLKECIMYYLGQDNMASLSKLVSQSNTEALANLIGSHKLGGLFHFLVTSGGLETAGFPDSLLSGWKHASWKNSFGNYLNDLEGASIMTQFNKAGINYTYLKGAACRKFHKAEYIRSSVDIDLFIDQGDYPETKRILLANGYRIPSEHYSAAGILMPLEKYEEIAKEILFVKQEESTRYTVDLQWDFVGFDTSPLFKGLYDINNLILKTNDNVLILADMPVKVLSPENELYVMAFHYTFHHGFRGLKWLIDILSYINGSGLSYEQMTRGLSDNARKIIGILIMTFNHLSGIKPPDKKARKLLCIDRMLPGEFAYYRRMLFRTYEGIEASISHRLVKCLLPYRHRDKARVLGFFLFNSSSLQHRRETGEGRDMTPHLFAIFRVLAADMKKKRRNANGRIKK